MTTPDKHVLGKHVLQCSPPRWRKKRWQHVPWVCYCGQAWTSYWEGAGDGGAWLWQKWPRE